MRRGIGEGGERMKKKTVAWARRGRGGPGCAATSMIAVGLVGEVVGAQERRGQTTLRFAGVIGHWAMD